VITRGRSGQLRNIAVESARNILPPAVAFSLLIGVVQTTVAAFRIWGLHELTWVSRDIVWMAPLAHLLLFLAVGVALLIAAVPVRRPFPFSWAVGFYEFLFTVSLLISIREFPFSVICLGGGLLGVAGAREARTSPVLWRVRMRRTAVVLAALVFVAAATMEAGRRLAESHAVRLLPPTSDASPNVLVIVLDGVRSKNLSLFGYARRTSPTLERLANEGVSFERAFAPSAFSLASHGAMFSGERSGSLNVSWFKPLSDHPALLAEVLRRRGYITGGFTGNLLYTSFESGLARGFIHYDDFPRSLRTILFHSPFGRTLLAARLEEVQSLRSFTRALLHLNFKIGLVPADIERPAGDVTDHFLAWQRRLPTARPSFAFINYIDAHDPYHAPPRFQARFNGGTTRMDRYDASIAYLDSEVERLLDALRQRGALDRTIVIITADHGELFGEHGMNGHANSLYLPVLAVPLLVLWQGQVPRGIRVSPAVSLLDLPATILELTGGPGLLPGSSLAPQWRSTAGGHSRPPIAELIAVPRGQQPSPRRNAGTWLESVMTERFQYVRDGLGNEELFDYSRDPEEFVNLVADSASDPVLGRLRAVLDSAVGRPGGTGCRAPCTPSRGKQ
jgi:arylsulfatase A-like enzyme